MANLHHYVGPDTIELSAEELRALAEECRALAEQEFRENVRDVGYSCGTTGDDAEFHLHLIRLELGRQLTPGEERDFRAGFADGEADRAAFVRDRGAGLPPDWSDVPF